MDTDANFVTWVFAGLGILLSLISLPLIFQMVPPNSGYGFRTQRTMHDSGIWYTVNKIAGIDLCAAGILIAVLCAGAGFLMIGTSTLNVALVDSAITLGCIGLAVIHTLSNQ